MELLNPRNVTRVPRCKAREMSKNKHMSSLSRKEDQVFTDITDILNMCLTCYSKLYSASFVDEDI